MLSLRVDGEADRTVEMGLEVAAWREASSSVTVLKQEQWCKRKTHARPCKAPACGMWKVRLTAQRQNVSLGRCLLQGFDHSTYCADRVL